MSTTQTDSSFDQACRVLREQGEQTLQSLAQKLNLPQAKAASIMQIAIGNGAVVYDEVTDKYRVCAEYEYALLMRVGLHNVQYEVRDWTNTRRSGGIVHVSHAEVIAQIRQLVARMVLLYPQLRKCAIAMPCVMSDGVIVDWAKNPSWNGTELKRLIQSETPIEVSVENDMKVLASGARRTYRSHTLESAAVVCVDRKTYGVGLIAQGKVFAGKNGFAGEIAYLPLYLRCHNPARTAIRIIRVLAGVFAPHEVLLYLPDRYRERVVRVLKKTLPYGAMPVLIGCADPLQDMFCGLAAMCGYPCDAE